MKRVIIAAGVAVLGFFGATYRARTAPQFPAVPRELLCPPGTDLLNGHRTYDRSTGMYRDSVCVNLNGGLFLQTAGLISSSANPASTHAIRLANADSIEWRNAGNSADLPLAMNASNQLTFNGTVLSTASGISVAQVDLTAQSANIAATTILTPSANGFYRISGIEICTVAGSSGAFLPFVNVIFTEADAGTSHTIQLNATQAGATVLGNLYEATTYSFYAKSGVVMQYSTTSRVYNGSPQYSLHLRVEGAF